MAGAFYWDVFARRVVIDSSWLAPLWAVVSRFRRQPAVAAAQPLSRLKAVKESVGVEFTERQRTTRFIAEPPVPKADPTNVEEVPVNPLVESPTTTYTERLLASKQQARRQMNEQ
jgi:hypothetical protein